MAKTDKPITVITLPALAKKLGYHRSTLVRMEGKGVIPSGSWHPRLKCRVYTPEQQEAVKKAIDDYNDRLSRFRGDGIMVVDPSEIQVERD